MERDAPGAERKWSVRQGVVPGTRDSRAYLLLPAPEAPAGSLHSAGTGPAIAVGRGSVGSETGREPRQTAADYQGRYSGNHGCRQLCAGPGVADDAPC